MKHRSLERLEPRRLFAAGDPDPSFGVGGVARHPLEATVTVNVGEAKVIAGDKVLLGGDIYGPTSLPTEYLLRRYNADGSPDTTFGDGGSVIGRFQSSSKIVQIETAPDGKIVTLVTDHATSEGDPEHTVIARFNADGSVDTSFGGGDGWISLAGIEYPFASQIRVTPDGRIVAVHGNDVFRFTDAGAPDTTFGGDGRVDDVVGGQAGALLPLADGSLLVAGTTQPAGSEPQQFALVKLNVDGSRAQSFGDGGAAVGLEDQLGRVVDIDLLPDGRILVSGMSGFQIAAIAYAAGGALDTTFGDGGISRGFRTALVRTLVDDQGRIYFTAHGGTAMRLTADGDRDDSFGRVGGVGGAEATGSFASAGGFNAAGRLIFGGSEEDYFGRNRQLLVLARLTEDDGVPSPVRLEGRTVTATGTGGDDSIIGNELLVEVTAQVNGFARFFDKDDMDLIAIDAGVGNDRVLFHEVRSRPTSVSGGDGNDIITGSQSGDTLNGNAGRDFIDGYSGADLINGNGGNDRLRGMGGHDRVRGGAGNDGAAGDSGNDRLDGGAGADVLLGGAGDDLFLSSADGVTDRLFGGDGTDTATDADEDDELDGIESLP